MIFNVGDKVRTKPDVRRFTIDRKVVTIRAIDRGYETFRTDDSTHRNHDYAMSYFELVEAAPNPIEVAKALLVAEGYTVTDPPKPRTRDVVAYCFDKNPETVHFAELHYFVNKRDWASPPIRIGGTFQWTEELKL